MEESKKILAECENTIKKRFWPAGKKKAWLLVINAWLEIDRRESLRLLTNLSFEMKKNFILRLNKKFPLKPVEWGILENDQSVYRITEDMVDQNQELIFSENVLYRTAQNIRAKLQNAAAFSDEKIPNAHYEKFQKLLLKHIGKVSENMIIQLVEEIYKTIVTADSLNNVWLTRFNLATHAISLLILCGIQVEETFRKRLLPVTPPYMQKFAKAFFAGRKPTSIEGISQVYTALMQETQNDYHVEAWFLMTLIMQGYGETALQYAGSSEHSNKLLPRLRRLAIFYQGTSGTLVKPEDVSDSVLCQFLAQPSVEERVNYLIKVTSNGNNGLPADIWGRVDTLAIMLLSSHTDSADFKEMKSLYASIYFKTTEKDKLFGEYLRLSGFGVCRYGDVDTILTEALHEWSKKDAQAVRNVLQNTWAAVKPDTSIFHVEVIYSALLEHCRNVFAVDPDFFIRDYLFWFKTFLVQGGIQWQEGDVIRTLRFPETGPFNQALLGAMNIGAVSVDKRDTILRLAMEKFKLDDKGALFAAQSYGEGKEEVPFQAPVKLEKAELSSWQVGMVGMFFKKLVDHMFIEEPD
ncbi:MAG: hypothetical protein GX115_06475 [Ruminiclostridium sp.]|nr:hypothetical protein [Ruminiclostridium sp.]